MQQKDMSNEKPLSTAAKVPQVRYSAAYPTATIIFEFLFCASAQGEDSKEKKGCGGKEGGKKNPFGRFRDSATQALRHDSAYEPRCGF